LFHGTGFAVDDELVSLGMVNLGSADHTLTSAGREAGAQI
jgi:hypothetical protein